MIKSLPFWKLENVTLVSKCDKSGGLTRQKDDPASLVLLFYDPLDGSHRAGEERNISIRLFRDQLVNT